MSTTARRAGAAAPIWTALLLMLPLAAAAQAQPVFMGLGDLPGGPFLSEASDLSADGSVVTGYSQTDQAVEAFRWTFQGGMVGIGALPGGSGQSTARAISADGTTIVGTSSSAVSPSQAFFWTAATGMVGLLDAPGSPEPYDYSFPAGVSADGRVICGTGINTGTEAFRWTAATGMVGLGDLDSVELDGIDSQANGISDDGTTIVGSADNDDDRLEAFRWTSATGMVGLGFLPGQNFSQASDATPDGAIISGSSGLAGMLANGEAFRWTSAGGFQSIGSLPPIPPSMNAAPTPRGMSDAANVITGDSVNVGVPGEIFYWDAAGGMRPLAAELTALGVDLTGWQLTTAGGVSADGRVIVGTGINPDGNREGFIVYLDGAPAAPPVPALPPSLRIALVLLLAVLAAAAVARRPVRGMPDA